jgi:hypothetical protein
MRGKVEMARGVGKEGFEKGYCARLAQWLLHTALFFRWPAHHSARTRRSNEQNRARV